MAVIQIELAYKTKIYLRGVSEDDNKNCGSSSCVEFSFDFSGGYACLCEPYMVGAKYEANIIPGQHIEDEIELNLGAEDLPVDIMTEILGLGQSLNGVYTMIESDQDDGLYSAQPFLNISPSNFHLNPGESKKVLISGDVPLDIGDGSRYALASIRGISKGSGPVGLSLVLNVPILLNISGS